MSSYSLESSQRREPCGSYSLTLTLVAVVCFVKPVTFRCVYPLPTFRSETSSGALQNSCVHRCTIHWRSSLSLRLDSETAVDIRNPCVWLQNIHMKRLSCLFVYIGSMERQWESCQIKTIAKRHQYTIQAHTYTHQHYLLNRYKVVLCNSCLIVKINGKMVTFVLSFGTCYQQYTHTAQHRHSAHTTYLYSQNKGPSLPICV